MGLHGLLRVRFYYFTLIIITIIISGIHETNEFGFDPPPPKVLRGGSS
jgi:hypothetical protein